MTTQLADVLLLAQSQASSVNDIVLAMLNVIQTVALAYLAADRHNQNRSAPPK